MTETALRERLELMAKVFDTVSSGSLYSRTIREASAALQSAEARAQAAEARVKVLEKALLPFAAAEVRQTAFAPLEDSGMMFSTHTVEPLLFQDFAAARQALQQGEGS